MDNNTTNKCRFCYNYKWTPPVTNCCQPQLCASNEYLGSISSLTPVVNNNTRTTERSLLLGQQQQFFETLNYNLVSSLVLSTIQNSTSITSTIDGQLLQLRTQRYLPYQPYVYPVVPRSVVELQMATANTGVAHSFFTFMDCKGVQSVTT